MDVSLSGFSLDDMRSGAGKWRNIQDSVRHALVGLCQTVTSQSKTIATLEAKLDALCGHVATHAGHCEEVHSQTAARIHVSVWYVVMQQVYVS